MKKIKIKIKIKISTFNKYFIFLISLLFLYLFYLSIPTLYNKDRLEKDLSNKLLNDFKIDFSLSSDINYLILPSPHFLVKDVKLFNKLTKENREIGQIKKMKIFVSQKNFFKQDNLYINKILLQESNFSLKKKDPCVHSLK